MQVLKLKTSSIESVVKQAVKVLQTGGLVIYPTETVYGVGVDATNTSAVKKLLDYKSRREGKPLSIAVASQAMAEQYVELTDQAEQLYKRFLPGPYTIVSKGKGRVAPGVESEFGTLGVRIPNYPLVLELVSQLGRPITATSANASGEKRPYTIDDILDRLSAKQKTLIDLVIDTGTLPKNEPSVVIDTTLSTPLTVRGSWHDSDDQAFETVTDQETQDLAGKLLLKHWTQVKKTGLVIALSGELGTGKTIFTKGLAKFLQITTPIVSPTYTYLSEYDFNRHGTRGKLFHLDLWKIDSQNELDRLRVSELTGPNNVVVIEWWQQGAPFWSKKSAPQLLLHFDEIDAKTRKISVKTPQP
jgi:L-threonylcarbamoyladenylate synthase